MEIDLMTTKEMFNALLKKKGYASLRDFCIKNSIDYPNMTKRVNGIRQHIEIDYAFKLANMLNVPVEKIIAIFYPNEFKENRENIKQEKYKWIQQ